MAEVADIHSDSTPVVAEEDSDCLGKKGIEKPCDMAIKEICGKGDNGPTDSAGAGTNEATTENVAPTADTTDGTPTTGTKRKCEDEKEPEASDDLKKVKTDELVTDHSEADPAVSNGGDNNGCHNVEGTNGKDATGIPAEIVTKTVEETVKPGSEDVVASS